MIATMILIVVAIGRYHDYPKNIIPLINKHEWTARIVGNMGRYLQL